MPNGDRNIPMPRESLQKLAAELSGESDPAVWDKMLDKILEIYYPKDAFPTLWEILEKEPQVRGVMKGVAAEAFGLGLQRGAFETTQEFQALIQEAQANPPGTTG